MRVVATLPVQQQVDLAALDGRDDLHQHRAKEAFAQLRRRPLMAPEPLQVLAQGKVGIALVGRQLLLPVLSRLERLQPGFTVSDPGQAGLPLAGQVVKHVLVGRLHRIELCLGPLGLVAGFSQCRLRPDGWPRRPCARAPSGPPTPLRYSTVRTHLKHIFAKLGVSRQLEVAQLVLALSSLPVSRD